MPELPEVETVRRDLEKVLVGKKITAVEVLDKKIVSVSPVIPSEASRPTRNPLKSVKITDFILALKNKKIVRIERRGKLLAFGLSSGEFLLAHLKMTGQLIYTPVSSPRKRGSSRKASRIKSWIPAFAGMTTVAGGHQIGKNDLQVPNKFTRVIIQFQGGILYFNDLRRFGYLKVVSSKEKEKIFKNSFGIEPLTPDFKLPAFTKIFQNRKTNLKAILMNQKLISGLGNIYVDEACFCAGLLPWRSAQSLKPAEIKKLFSCIQKVIAVAIKNRGTTFKDFVDGEGATGGHYKFLKVFDRNGDKCFVCKTVIKKIKHAGRGTHYCERCQK